MIRAAAVAGVAALGACATEPSAPDGPPASAGYAAEGARTAQTWCAGCHAMDAGPSPRASAPPFPVLGVRFNAITWERAMAQIAAGGHEEMPPLRLSDTDVRNLKAFIDTLR